jgi:hypothetical protein
MNDDLMPDLATLVAGLLLLFVAAPVAFLIAKDVLFKQWRRRQERREQSPGFEVQPPRQP